MKILLYGFGPYLNFKENISEKIIRRIKKRRGLVKVVFPARFNKKIFLEKARKLRPHIIIGIGQCAGNGKIRIETRAANYMRNNKKEKLHPIFLGGQRYYFTNPKLKADKYSVISRDAGWYVCNFSMYLFSDWAKKRGVKFAFLHIPAKFNLRRAVKFVEGKIDEITTI